MDGPDANPGIGGRLSVWDGLREISFIAFWPAWLLPAILAPFVGSFLGVLIRRLPAGRPVGLARSACEACGHVLGPMEMVPIAGFVALRGRCGHCGAPIAPAHLGVEVAALGIALAAGAVVADPAALWAACVLGWTVLALAWIDIRHFLLPDALTLPLVLAGLAVTWALQPAAVADHALAAALGYLALRGLGAAYRALRKRDGLGQGDAKLLAAAGAWTGLAALPVVVLGAALATLGWGIVAGIRAGRISGRTALPLGPALGLMLWLAWLSAWTDIGWLAALGERLAGQ